MQVEGRTSGALAIATGVVGLACVTSLTLFFIVAGPFGTINDLANAALGILSALLAAAFGPRGASRLPAAWVGAAAVGAVLTVIGSALVVSGTSGFLLAGLVSSVGFALIGVWLFALNRSMRADGRWPTRLTTLGTAGGLVMALGLATAPGIALGLDDMATAPGWIWIGLLGWLGSFLLYPAWAILVGRRLVRHPQISRGD